MAAKRKRGRKRPHARNEPKPRDKRPGHQDEEDSPNDANPSWQLRLLDTEGPFGWQELRAQKIWEIRSKLGQFESMTWHEILIRGKNFHHSIAIDQLAPEARKRLEDLQQDDVEALVSLRLSARERIFGIREGSILEILWWDPEHRVCPSEKKHT